MTSELDEERKAFEIGGGELDFALWHSVYWGSTPKNGEECFIRKPGILSPTKAVYSEETAHFAVGDGEVHVATVQWQPVIPESVMERAARNWQARGEWEKTRQAQVVEKDLAAKFSTQFAEELCASRENHYEDAFPVIEYAIARLLELGYLRTPIQQEAGKAATAHMLCYGQSTANGLEPLRSHILQMEKKTEARVENVARAIQAVIDRPNNWGQTDYMELAKAALTADDAYRAQQEADNYRIVESGHD